MTALQHAAQKHFSALFDCRHLTTSTVFDKNNVSSALFDCRHLYKLLPFSPRYVTRRVTNGMYINLNFPSKQIKRNKKSADEPKEAPPSLSCNRTRRIPTKKYLAFQKKSMVVKDNHSIVGKNKPPINVVQNNVEKVEDTVKSTTQFRCYKLTNHININTDLGKIWMIRKDLSYRHLCRSRLSDNTYCQYEYWKIMSSSKIQYKNKKNIVYCPDCNVHLCVDCYEPFHTL